MPPDLFALGLLIWMLYMIVFTGVVVFYLICLYLFDYSLLWLFYPLGIGFLVFLLLWQIALVKHGGNSFG